MDLVQMKRTTKGLGITIAILAAIGVSVLAMLALLNRQDQTVGLNQEIQYDDFAFSVLGVRQQDSLGKGETVDSHSVFYIVTIKIVNHAKRVYYSFKKNSAVLIDAAGREFHMSRTGQEALESAQGQQCAEAIPAGAWCKADVVFELPTSTRITQFRVSEGGLAGDILDVMLYGKKRIALEAH
jgi:hypothetical protein